MSFRAVSKFSQPFRDALDLLRFTSKEWRVATAFGDRSQSHSAVNTSNFLFQLHSKVTVVMLLVGTSLVTLKVFGDPVDCLTHPSTVSKEMLQRFCWMEGAFSLHTPPTDVSDSGSPQQAYPGVAQSGNRVNHRYYQWVYFVLLLQAIMFYAPRHVWRAKEANAMRGLIKRLKAQPFSTQSLCAQKLLLQELFDMLLLGDNFLYYFVVCELFYVVNLVAQFWFTNVFLGGSFLNLGWKWFVYANQYTADNAYDPLVKVFPRLVKCNFHSYGISGSLQLQDALCFLPINVINEKIYVILWMWFVFLFLLTSAYFCFHLMLVAFASLRYIKLRFHAPTCNGKHLRQLVRSPGNWFVLEFIAINLKPSYFKEVITNLFEEFYDENGRPLVEESVMIKYREQLLANGGSSRFQGNSNNGGRSTRHYNNSNNNGNNGGYGFDSMSGNNGGGGLYTPSQRVEGFAGLTFGAVNKNASLGKKSKKPKNKYSAIAMKPLDDEWPEPNEQSELLNKNHTDIGSDWDLPSQYDTKRNKDDQDNMDQLFVSMFSQNDQDNDTFEPKKKSGRGLKSKKSALPKTVSQISLEKW